MIGEKLTREELLEFRGGTWTCECMGNIGRWESQVLKEGISTAQWACEGSEGVIATCSGKVKGKNYKINIKKKSS